MVPSQNAVYPICWILFSCVDVGGQSRQRYLFDHAVAQPGLPDIVVLGYQTVDLSSGNGVQFAELNPFQDCLALVFRADATEA